MIPLFYKVVVDKVKALLQRTCPACQRTQVVLASQIRHMVRCKSCGANIPPRKMA